MSALEGSAITSIRNVAGSIKGASTNYLARTKGAVRQRRPGWSLVLGVVALWWVLESVSDTFVFGEGDLASTLFPDDPAEMWDRGSLAAVLLGFVAYARWSFKDITERKNVENKLRCLNLELAGEAEKHASVLAERDERLRALVTKLLASKEEERDSAAVDGARRDASGACPLTERELEVVRFLAAGSTNRQIAEALHLSPATVKGHVERIIRKLKVRDRTQAAVKATALGLVDGSEEQKRAV